MSLLPADGKIAPFDPRRERSPRGQARYLVELRRRCAIATALAALAAEATRVKALKGETE